MSSVWPLACPVCALPLSTADDGRVLRCAAGHSFDRARQGHVNLLAAGRGRPSTTGDTRAMVEARRRFLGAGPYAPLVEAVAQATAAALADAGASAPSPPVVVDVGCGEGTYLRATIDASSSSEARFFGVDLSKDAVRLAASADKRARFVVGDARHRLCFLPGSVDVVLNVFAPREVNELARVCRPGARLLVVIPEPDHLLEVRERFGLLGIEEEKRERTLERLATSFALNAERTVRAPLRLEGAALGDLLAMTPSAFHLDEGALKAAESAGAVATSLSARVLTLTRAIELSPREA